MNDEKLGMGKAERHWVSAQEELGKTQSAGADEMQ